VAHTLDWLMFFSDRNKVLTWGIASVAGVVLLSMRCRRRDFQWQGFADRRDLARHLLGGLLMGVGGDGHAPWARASARSPCSAGQLCGAGRHCAGAVLMLRHLAETA
jgi:hypothetical protein